MAGTERYVRNSTADFLVFTKDSETDGIEVRVQDHEVWLTQKGIGQLFDVDRSVVAKHLRNIFAENELSESTTCAKFAQVADNGKTYHYKFYSLPAIIAVGYRTNSTRATQFRQWATKVLDTFTRQGYVLDKDRLINGQIFDEDYFDHLVSEIQEIRASERRFYQKITDIYATAVDYSVDSKTTKDFFATVQNKMHYAVHGSTAAEVIVQRADHTKDHMGLTSWKNAPNGKIVKADVSVAKNYLQQDELQELNEIVTMYLDYAQEQKYLRKTITGILRSATGMADFADKLKTAGIETKVKKATGQVLYRATVLDGAWVPEDALGSEFTSEGIEYALKNGKMQITEDAEITLLDRYQKLTIQYPEVCTAAVKLSSRQILSAGKNGLVLQAHDDNGNPAKLMVNKSEVTTSPDGEITFNVGNDFSYDLVYEDGTHGTILGAKLIQQIDEENHVEPVQVILSENQIKAMSIRGVTIHLPQNGIERLFIPEKYVLRDLDAGQCTVLLYPNQQYSYVPIGDSKKRLNIQGDRLSEFLGSSINPITESTGLKRKIAAVERRAGIENAKFLGKMLQGMADSRIHTTGDYDKVIHDLGKTRIGLTNELAEVKQKRTTYAAAAKHLQICRTYKSVWMEYVAKPLNQKTGYFNQHSMELQVYRTAAAKLEKEGIDQSVEIDKVNNFAQILESKINDLAEQLREIDLQEQDYRRERETLTAIQADLCE